MARGQRVMSISSRLLITVAVAGLIAAPGAAVAQTVDDVFPLEPADGATVGTKPTLRVGVEGTEVLKMRFRVEMSRDDFDTIDYVFDQVEDRGNWGFVAESGGWETPGGMYLVRVPLADGVYDWRASAWDGVKWVDGKTVYRLTVDAVPPAEVEGIRMDFDPRTPAIVLDWEPVAFDLEGRPEVVARYHVYKYYQRTIFFVFPMRRAATVEVPHFEDTDPMALGASVVYYKITAEDESGNETGRAVFGAGPRAESKDYFKHYREAEESNK